MVEEEKKISDTEAVQEEIPSQENVAGTAEQTVQEPVQTADTESQPEESGKTSFRDKKKQNAEIHKLQAQVEEATKTAEELRDRYTRMCAEFENYKRRTGKELDARYTDAKGDVWKSVLPVVDNFERALSQETDDSVAAYRQGVEMIYRQLTEVMKAAGVTEIEAQGAEFDPELHNAVMHVEDDSVGANTVVEVFAKGYRMGDKILRYSMVKVAN